RPLRLYLLPLHTVGGVPDVAVEGFLRRRELRDGLAAHDPDAVAEGEGVVQRPRPPGHLLRDEPPVLCGGAVPHVVVVVALVDVAADDPQAVAVDDVPGCVAALPVAAGVEGAVEEGVGPDQAPGPSVARGPDLVVADAREVLPV